MRVAPAIVLCLAVRTELEKLARRRTTPVRVTGRCRIVLLAADSQMVVSVRARTQLTVRGIVSEVSSLRIGQRRKEFGAERGLPVQSSYTPRASEQR